MKVIKGNFNKDEGPDHAGERLRFQLEESKIMEESTGSYVLFFDAPDSIMVMTNGEGAGDVLLVVEKGKAAIMSAIFHAEVGKGPTGGATA